MGATSCQTGNRPNWNAEFWAGHSLGGSIVRDQDEQELLCTAPEFDDFVCLTYDDLLKLETEVLSKCERWQGDESYR